MNVLSPRRRTSRVSFHAGFRRYACCINRSFFTYLRLLDTIPSFAGTPDNNPARFVAGAGGSFCLFQPVPLYMHIACQKRGTSLPRQRFAQENAIKTKFAHLFNGLHGCASTPCHRKLAYIHSSLNDISLYGANIVKYSSALPCALPYGLAVGN